MALLPTEGVIRPGEAIRSVFMGPLNSPDVGVQVTLTHIDNEGKIHHRHVYVASSVAGDNVAHVAKAWCEAYMEPLTESQV